MYGVQEACYKPHEPHHPEAEPKFLIYIRKLQIPIYANTVMAFSCQTKKDPNTNQMLCQPNIDS